MKGNSITGINFTGNSYRIVVCERDNGFYKVVFRGEFFKEEERKLLEKCKEYFKNTVVIGSLPPENTFYRTLELPFKDLKKILRILPNEMESYIPFKTDEIVTTCLKDKDKNKIVGVAVKKELLREFVREIDEKGFMVDILKDPILHLRVAKGALNKSEGVLLHIDKNFSGIVNLSEDGIYSRLLRWGNNSIVDEEDRQTFASEVLRTLKNVYQNRAQEISIKISGEGVLNSNLTDLLKKYFNDIEPVKPEDINVLWNYPEEEFFIYFPALALCLDEKGSINLRTGEFSASFNKGFFTFDVKKPAIVTAIALFFINTGVFYKNKIYKDRAEILKTRELNIFVDSFPTVKKVFDPYAQMKELLGKTKEEKKENKNVNFINILYTVSKDAQGANIKLEELSYFEGVMDIDGKAREVELIDTFSKRLSERDIFTDVKVILSRKEKSGDFKFRIRVSTK